MFCKNCGNKLENGAKFCTGCGTKVEIKKEKVTEEKVIAEPVNNNVQNRSKAPVIIIIILLSLILIGIIVAIVLKLIPDRSETSTSNKGETTIIDKNKDNKVNSNSNKTKSNSGNTASSNTASSNTSSGSSKKADSYTVMGTEDFGYLTLPGKWYRFRDVSGKTALQYTLDSVWIVSLESLEKTDKITAENLAKTAMYSMENGTDNVTGVTGTKTKVGKYNAYKVLGYYEDDNIWLAEWFFEPGNGKVHYISIEGNDKYSEYFDIADTFSLIENN